MARARIDDGGPAFPKDEYYEEKRHDQTNGMSLRDYIATKAMHAEILTSASDLTPKACDALIEAAGEAGRDVIDQIAFNAYAMADAMLRARKK
jgi:hypothetical protein